MDFDELLNLRKCRQRQSNGDFYEWCKTKDKRLVIYMRDHYREAEKDVAKCLYLLKRIDNTFIGHLLIEHFTK